MDMFLQHVQGTFVRPSQLVLDIPPWLDTLVCQLLEKKPEQRPFDAAMVSNVLDSIQENRVTATALVPVRPARGRLSTTARVCSPRWVRWKNATSANPAATATATTNVWSIPTLRSNRR